MKKTLICIAIVIMVVCTGCSTLYNFERIETGMTQAQVVELLGKPESKGFVDGMEIYTYSALQMDFFWDQINWYEIRFKDGIVVEYCQTGFSILED